MGTILMVEHEEPGRKALLESLTREGYTVLEASDGAEAIQIVLGHEDPIHLLVTDVVMPGMSGGELAQRLRSISMDMKVLYIPGYTEDTVVPHGVSDGHTAFLKKPFTLMALTRKIRQLMDE